MKNRKIPMRSCAVSREKLPKSELLRIVKCPDGKICVDETGKLNGRGSYIKRDITVLDKAIKSRVKTAIKKVDAAVAAGDKELAKANLQLAISELDKATTKGVYHKNTSSRKISRLTLAVNKIA